MTDPNENLESTIANNLFIITKFLTGEIFKNFLNITNPWFIIVK